MKKIRVQDAVGLTLCHDLTGINIRGEKCVMYRRGHVISPHDIEPMLNIGKSHIYTWNPNSNEVHEDDAALLLAKPACGRGIEFDKKPSEGKIVMRAKTDGLFVVNGTALTLINSIGDYTLSCIPNYSPVKKSDKLGGLRIVPLVTKRRTVDKAVNIARECRPVFKVLPYRELKCGVIITGNEVYYGRIEDKFEKVMTEKLSAYNSDVVGFTKCPDDLAMLKTAINDYKLRGADIIFLTGGMSVDPDDLTPSAIRASATRMVTQGVPMQPGNMLTLAYMGKTLLIGVPGASMHSKTTSLDVFLPRVFAGVKIRREDIKVLGEGGFCQGCEVCRYPVCYFGFAGK